MTRRIPVVLAICGALAVISSTWLLSWFASEAAAIKPMGARWCGAGGCVDTELAKFGDATFARLGFAVVAASIVTTALIVVVGLRIRTRLADVAAGACIVSIGLAVAFVAAKPDSPQLPIAYGGAVYGAGCVLGIIAALLMRSDHSRRPTKTS